MFFERMKARAGRIDYCIRKHTMPMWRLASAFVASATRVLLGVLLVVGGCTVAGSCLSPAFAAYRSNLWPQCIAGEVAGSYIQILGNCDIRLSAADGQTGDGGWEIENALGESQIGILDAAAGNASDAVAVQGDIVVLNNNELFFGPVNSPNGYLDADSSEFAIHGPVAAGKIVTVYTGAATQVERVRIDDNGIRIGGTLGTAFPAIKKYSATIDVASIAAQACTQNQIDPADTADLNDPCFTNFPTNNVGLIRNCYYDGTQILLDSCNNTGAAIDPASATYTCWCIED